MKSNRNLPKATEFYRISLNSLQISLQISLWMSFMEFTAGFITDFIIDFTANFMLIPPYFSIDFMTNFITFTRISLILTRFHEIHNISQDFTEINRISLWI